MQDTPGVSPSPSALPSETETETSFSIYAYQWLGAEQPFDAKDTLWNTSDPEDCTTTPRKGEGGDWQLLRLELNLEDFEKQEDFMRKVETFRDRVKAAYGEDLGVGRASR
ncbi:hypothetical protein [Salipiger sp. PrR002]|uniref:hypothetical protein n=1 Tax=Salipiger sp. PrR002 TaxID=2706489 RepID=UPI0013B9095B|nr:hypothetical protein [Salipiger sp. PrR002]NDW01926.1 hypothetical protein [Salipiger sp. PrR002]NDW58996.1 hypothetical protein [Salipiger sp. PrR004]